MLWKLRACTRSLWTRDGSACSISLLVFSGATSMLRTPAVPHSQRTEKKTFPKARVGREVQIEPSQGSQLGLGRHCPSDQGDQLRFAYGFGRCVGSVSLHNHLYCGGRSPLR